MQAVTSDAWQQKERGGPLARTRPGDCFPYRPDLPVSDIDSHARWYIPALVVFAFLLRAPFFGSPAVHIDEQFYLTVAEKWVHHGMIPFVDIWDRKPLGTFIVYALPALTPFPILGYQILATVFVVGTGIATIEIGALIASRRVGFMAALVYAVAVGLMEGPGGQTPVFYNLPVAIAMYLYLDTASAIQRPTFKRIVAVGLGSCLLLGLAIQIKYVAAIEGAALSLFYLAALHVRHRVPLGHLVMLALGMIVLGLLPTALVASVYSAIGHWPEFFESNFASIFAKHLWNLPFAEFLRRFQESSLFCVFFLPFAAYALLTYRRARFSERAGWAFAGIALWVVTALPGALMLGNPTRHYFLPTLAPMALLTAFGLSRVAASSGALGRFFASLEKRAGGYGALLAILLVPLIGTVIIAIQNPRERGEKADVYAVVDEIRRYLQPGECMLVFNRLPILYMLTDSCAPSQYMFPNHNSEIAEVRTPDGERLKELQRVLASKPPVIYVRRPFTPDIAPEAIAMFEKAVETNYDLRYVRRAYRQFHAVYTVKQKP